MLFWTICCWTSRRLPEPGQHHFQGHTWWVQIPIGFTRRSWNSESNRFFMVGFQRTSGIPQHLVLLSPGLCGIVTKATTDLEVLVPGGGSPFVGPPQLLDRVSSRDSPVNSEDNLSSNKDEEDSTGEVAEVVPTGMNLRLEDLPLPLVIETLRVGARLTNFVQQWQNLLGDCRASRTLGNGVQLEWESLPPLTRTPISFSTRNTPKDLQTAVDKLLSKGAIEPVFRPETKGFFSRLFLVPKKTGDLRPVIDLSRLNDHLVIPRFKMETQASVRASIKENEWTVSIDIQDAYLHVPMARSVRKYLRFMVNGRVYQFTCLPFGLATSPREFTKLLRPVVQLLRLQGIKLHVYLDDWLIRASSAVQARTHADLVLQVLQHLGWVINFSKSDLVPSQQFDFIGMQFNTCAYTVAPLPKMRVKIQNTLDHWRSHPLISARDLHRLLGMLTFMATLVPRGRLRLRPIQWWASEIWCQEMGFWSDRISVTPTILHQVAWWASPAVLQGVSLSALETEITLFTDASSHGWGAQLGSRTLQGTWSSQQASQHINLLEMEAVFLSVTRFLPQLKSRVVRLMCDNAVVVLYINKEGGTKSFRLTRLTIRLLKFCDRKGIRLVPVHLPGSRNIQADALSRVGQTLATEWAINGQLLHPVFSAWGTPVIDLFATFANRKLPVFASPFPDQRAKYVDAMSVPWSGMGMVYAFPPFKMLPAVLNKIRRSHNLNSSMPDVSIMDARAIRAVSLSSNTTGRASTSYSRSSAAKRSRRDKTLPTLKSTRLATLKGLFVKLGYSRRVAECMSTNLRPSSIGCYESHWSRFVEYCRRKHLNVFEVDSRIFSKYLLHLFENERYAPSTIISHRTSIASVLRHWKYDPATDPRLRALLRNFQLARPVQRRLMPQWDLHLVLTALLRPPFTDSANDRPSDDVIDLKWRTLKTTFLLALATARRRSFLHALCVSTCLFTRGDVQDQLVVNLLPQAGFLAKTQLPDQAPQWIRIPGIAHLNPGELERMLCPVRQLQLYLRDTERIRGGRTRLLLHWDPLIDDIQRTHVSRWLVEVVQEAYTRADLEYDDDIRAHELRAIASSWAYVNQVRLEDILAAASWRSSGVFQGSYLRDMSSIADGMATLGPIVAAQHVVCTRRQ